MSNNILFLLVLLVAIGSGLMTLFFFMGVSKILASKNRSNDLNEFLEEMKGTEFKINISNGNEPERGTWAWYWYELFINAGQKFDNNATPGNIAIGAAFFAAIFGFFVWPGSFVGLIAGLVAAPAILRMWMLQKKKARLALMEKQIPNMLSGIRANLQIGSTPQRAIISQADELPAPLGGEIKLLKQQLESGQTIYEALDMLAYRVPSKEVVFLVAAMQIAIKSGTQLAPLVEKIEKIIVQRTRIANHLASAIARAQPTLLIAGAALPLGFLWSFSSSPENREFWLSFPTGLIVMIIVAFCYAVGLGVTKFLIDRVKKA